MTRVYTAAQRARKREQNRERQRERNRERRADPAYKGRENKHRRERYATDPTHRERVNKRQNERYFTDLAHREHKNRQQRERRAANPAERERMSKQQRERLAANPGYAHGLAAADVAEMWEWQKDLCPLCNLPLGDDAVIDHWHECKLHKPERGCHACVRFVAHGNCNAFFGFLGDTPAVLCAVGWHSAAERIERADRRKRLWLDVVPTESRPRRKRAAP